MTSTAYHPGWSLLILTLGVYVIELRVDLDGTGYALILALLPLSTRLLRLDYILKELSIIKIYFVKKSKS